jgi:ribonucleoside-diphosphate reductase alpha chain
LSPGWRQNAEEERLLGVSIAGIPDHALLNGSRGKKRLESFLEEAREHVWEVNAEWAEKLGINPTAAATCLKPSGNASQLVGAASPLKPHHAAKYIRRTRGNTSDPVTKLLIDQGMPHEDEAWHPDTTVVFEWPTRAPSGAATRKDWTALKQLELWLTYKEHWCDHNPSVTVNVKEHEWAEVAAWAWSHWDQLLAVAFLPDEDHTYIQAPYEEVDDETFADLEARVPDIDFSLLSQYEQEDRTTSSRELACTANGCSVM